MNKEELFQKNNEIIELERLSDFHYENIFNMYKTEGGFYGYNILKSIIIPEELDPKIYDTVLIDRQMSWTNLSFLEYGTIKLWWLICLCNGILNPVYLPAPGTVLKMIKPSYIKDILSEITGQI